MILITFTAQIHNDGLIIIDEFPGYTVPDNNTNSQGFMTQ